MEEREKRPQEENWDHKIIVSHRIANLGIMQASLTMDNFEPQF